MTEIVKISTGIDTPDTVKRVRALLSVIPVSRSGFGFQSFHGLRLIDKNGNRFILSMQGSDGHYSEPRKCLERLTDYEAVEIGIIPDERNKTELFRLGRSYSWDSGEFELVQSGETDLFGREKRGWLQPPDIGFSRVTSSNCDDVIGYVEVSDLVGDLADFFDAGGVIDGEHEDTKVWLDKLRKALES